MNIFDDAKDGISDWWNRNGATFVRGTVTVVIGASTVVVAMAAVPAAALFGGTVLVVAGNVAIY